VSCLNSIAIQISWLDCLLIDHYSSPHNPSVRFTLFGLRAQSNWRVALSIKIIGSSVFPLAQSSSLSAKRPRRVGTYSIRYPNRMRSG